MTGDAPVLYGYGISAPYSITAVAECPFRRDRKLCITVERGPEFQSLKFQRIEALDSH